MHSSLGAWRRLHAIRLSKAGTSRRQEKETPASGQPGAAARGGWAPTAGLLLGGWAGARRQAPSAGWTRTSQTALCHPGRDLGRPVSCTAHTPTGLRAVRLVPKANTELIFPAYSFHVWAASGFAGSLGSLLPALLKPPGPSALLAPGVLAPLRPSPHTVFHFTWARGAPEEISL